MKWSVYKCCVSTVVFALVPIFSLAEDKSGVTGNSDILKLLSESYLSNRESFTHLKATFQWTQVEAESASKALEGEFTKRDESINCSLIITPGRRRYDYICGVASQSELSIAIEQARKSKGAGTLTVPCLSWQLLEGNGYALRYSLSAQMANLFVPGGGTNDGVRISPFNPGTMASNEISNPTWYFRQAMSGRFRYEYSGAAEEEDPTVSVAIVSERLRDEFSFDPTRGHILTRNVSTNLHSPIRVHEMRLLKAVECSKGRWFPLRLVTVYRPDELKAMQCWELSVQTYDADYKDVPTDWELEISPDTPISLPEGAQWTQTPKDRPEKFSLDQLPSLHGRCIEQGKKQKELQNDMEDGKSSNQSDGSPSPAHSPVIVSNFKRTILLTNFALMLVAGGYFLSRWRKSSSK